MKKFRLRNLIRRDTSFRPIEIEDMKWLWAAYKTGSFDAVAFPEDLAKEELTDMMLAHFASMHEVFVLETETKRGKIPVGVVGSLITERTEPHVNWFSWATSRNKLECATYFFSKMRNRPLLVWSKEEHVKFYTHVSRYGVLRRIGKVYKFIDNEDYMLFQTRGA